MARPLHAKLKKRTALLRKLKDVLPHGNGLSIGPERTRKSPIKKIALATANEPKASATSWLEDADLVQAAQASRAQLEAETERANRGSPWLAQNWASGLF
jgi:hypothetical protein